MSAWRHGCGTLTALALGALVGCAPTPQPLPTMPSNGPYGPGVERESGGRRVDLVERQGGLVARYRVRRDSLRVYGPDAAQLGRIRVDTEGFAVVGLDGDTVCALTEPDGLRLQCGERVVTLDASDAPTLALDDVAVGQLRDLEGQWSFAYANAHDAAVEQSDGGVSVRTHDSARRWIETEPTTWHPAALVMSQVTVPGFEAAEQPLLRAALAFGIARRFDALPSVGGEGLALGDRPSDGSGSDGSGDDSSDGSGTR